MSKKSVFEFKSYKSVMAYFLTGEQKRGQLTRAAEALNCQRSYLSRVITAELHITPDHAFNLATFWNFNQEERIYFQTLVECERAVDRNYRRHLESVIAQLKKNHDSIEERTDRSALTIDATQSFYFSTWIWSAIHFLTAIPEYQNLAALMDRLGLKKESALFYLKQLEALGFIEHKNEKWIYKSGEFHTAKNSPLSVLNHQNWRHRAVADSQDMQGENLHYTGVHTLSRADAERLKELLLNFIADANRISGPSKPEEAIAITCDLFRV